MPAKKPGVFQPDDPRINRRGRPPVGLSLADKVRAIVGQDGAKLVEFWAGIAFNRVPALGADKSSSRVSYLTELQTFAEAADLDDRIGCSKLLAERGFGKPKETTDHTGSITVRWQT